MNLVSMKENFDQGRNELPLAAPGGGVANKMKSTGPRRVPRPRKQNAEDA